MRFGFVKFVSLLLIFVMLNGIRIEIRKLTAAIEMQTLQRGYEVAALERIANAEDRLVSIQSGATKEDVEKRNQ